MAWSTVIQDPSSLSSQFNRWYLLLKHIQDSLLVRAPDLWSNGCKFESQQERQENYLLQSQFCVLSFIWCPFSPHITTAACKRPRSFCKKCRLHLKTPTPVTHPSWNGLTMPLSTNSVWIFQETSSHETRQGTLGPVLSACWATADWSWPKEWN